MSSPTAKSKQQRADGRRGKEIASNERIQDPSSKPSLSPAPTTPVSYTVCTTASEAVTACAVLRTAPYVLVDCEGCDANTLSLVQIGTPHADQIYIFDFIALGPGTPHAAVVCLLADPRVLKVFWDGRNDYSDLLSACGVRVAPSLDLQLIDIHSRAVRNLGYFAHIQRLLRKTSPMSVIKKLQLEDVHVLNGMDHAIQEHSVSVALKDRECRHIQLLSFMAPLRIEHSAAVRQMHAEGRTGDWLLRPLPTFLLDYAAGDIARIAALYDDFVEKLYLTTGNIASMQIYSDIYFRTSLPLTPEECAEGNVYKRSNILPLGVVPRGFGYGAAAKYRLLAEDGLERNFVCDKCAHELPRFCFPFVLTEAKQKSHVRQGRYTGPGDSTAFSFPRSTSCKACTVHLAREEFEQKEAAKKQEKRDEMAKSELEAAAAPGQETPPAPGPEHPPVQQRMKATQPKKKAASK